MDKDRAKDKQHSSGLAAVEGGESQWMNFADDGGQQVNMSEDWQRQGEW